MQWNVKPGNRYRAEKDGCAPIPRAGVEQGRQLHTKVSQCFSSDHIRAIQGSGLWNKRIQNSFSDSPISTELWLFPRVTCVTEQASLPHQPSQPATLNYTGQPTKAIFWVRSERAPWYVTEACYWAQETHLHIYTQCTHIRLRTCVCVWGGRCVGILYVRVGVCVCMAVWLHCACRCTQVHVCIHGCRQVGR